MKLLRKEYKNNYYKRIFHLVTPIVVQNLLSAAVGSADVIMLNYVVSLSNKSYKNVTAHYLYIIICELGKKLLY